MELLFAEHLFGLLAAAYQVGHDLLSRAKGHVLINLEALRRNFGGDLVRESLELSEDDTIVVLELHLLSQLHTLLAGLVVVRRHKEHVLLAHVADDVLHVIIVARVGLLDGVPHWGLNASLCGKLALLIHVGATDQLDAKVVA